jgi:shikimate kinase
MKPAAQSNIVLIGMPGSGKSTVGVILAKHASRDFVDTDILIQTSEQKSLQQIIDEEGTIALREVEEQILLSLSVRNHVIATGGSAAYSSAAMKHLKSDGIVVFLYFGLNYFQERNSDFFKRGISRITGQTIRDH